jgi:probable DNA metabolism protein
MILIYDGTFETFLSLVYEVYYKKLKPTSILKEYPDTLILEDIKEIEFNETNSLKVLDALKVKFEKQNFNMIFNIFMCDNDSFEMDLLHYIILGFKDQGELKNINHPAVFNLQNLQSELFRYNHKMTGFLRFEELEDGTLYAKVDSKFNIVYFQGKHFFKRFNNQSFIIHDIKRKLAFIKNDSFKGIQKVTDFDIPTVSKNEEKFKKLWKTFFDSVAIETRENKKLQQQFVPLIYRTYMSEFN